MEKNPLNRGLISENFGGIGPVTRDMIHARARELALIAGHPAPHVTQVEYEQAKRELTGETEIDPQAAMVEALPESARWDPVPGSAGRQVPKIRSQQASTPPRLAP